MALSVLCRRRRETVSDTRLEMYAALANVVYGNVPSRKHLGNFGPPIAHRHVRFENRSIFLEFPRFLANIGI